MSKKIVIAGGGTGGHIYPGIAIAKALLQLDAQTKISFVGTSAGLETKIVPKEGFHLDLIEVGKLNLEGGRLQKIKTILKMPLSLISAAKLILKIKPDYVLGVGGYASGPFVLMAALMGRATAVWEANAIPGMTNRWLSRVVRTSFVVFEQSKNLLHSKRVIQLGLPVRSEVERLANIQQDRNVTLPLKQLPVGKEAEKYFHVLVFGGSQGARAINKVVTELVTTLGLQDLNVVLIHQTGVHDYAATAKAYEGRKDVEALEYLHNMENYYQWADLVICRSGASTVAEIAAARKPAIFIPLPWAADDHQTINAMALVEKGAAFLLAQKDLTAASLKKLIQELVSEVGAASAEINSNSKVKLAIQNLKQFHSANGATSVAQEILKEVR